MDANYMQEVEKLARTLRASRVAQTEGEARRMAEEMLSTSKRVHEDHKAREKEYYGEKTESKEMQTAHKMMEQISANMAKGKTDVRLKLDEIDANKPLKDLFPQEEAPIEQEEEDDAVLLNVESKANSNSSITEADLASPRVQHSLSMQGRSPEVIEIGGGDDDFFDDDNDDGSEEEKDSDSTPTLEDSSSETKESSEEDEFSVKEL